MNKNMPPTLMLLIAIGIVIGIPVFIFGRIKKKALSLEKRHRFSREQRLKNAIEKNQEHTPTLASTDIIEQLTTLHHPAYIAANYPELNPCKTQDLGKPEEHYCIIPINIADVVQSVADSKLAKIKDTIHMAESFDALPFNKKQEFLKSLTQDEFDLFRQLQIQVILHENN